MALVDLDLPDVDGFELIGKMRKHFPDLPIVAISGVVQRHVLESAKAIGADEALSKPVTPEWQDAIDRARKARGARH